MRPYLTDPAILRHGFVTNRHRFMPDLFERQHPGPPSDSAFSTIFKHANAHAHGDAAHLLEVDGAPTEYLQQ